VDPVSSLVAIVQLIGMYRQERSGRVQDDRQTFIDWLDGHRHEEIKNLTVADGDLSREVSDLLRQDHALLSQQLADVNRAVTESLSHTRMFANLAESTGTVPPVSSAPFRRPTEQATLYNLCSWNRHVSNHHDVPLHASISSLTHWPQRIFRLPGCAHISHNNLWQNKLKVGSSL